MQKTCSFKRQQFRISGAVVWLDFFDVNWNLSKMIWSDEVKDQCFALTLLTALCTCFLFPFFLSGTAVFMLSNFVCHLFDFFFPMVFCGAQVPGFQSRIFLISTSAYCSLPSKKFLLSPLCQQASLCKDFQVCRGHVVSSNPIPLCH